VEEEEEEEEEEVEVEEGRLSVRDARRREAGGWERKSALETLRGARVARPCAARRVTPHPLASSAQASIVGKYGPCGIESASMGV